VLSSGRMLSSIYTVVAMIVSHIYVYSIVYCTVKCTKLTLPSATVGGALYSATSLSTVA
jgi:hypothetical protein